MKNGPSAIQGDLSDLPFHCPESSWLTFQTMPTNFKGAGQSGPSTCQKMCPGANAARREGREIALLVVCLLAVSCLMGCTPSANDSSTSATDSPAAGQVAARSCNGPELLQLWHERGSN